MVPAIDLYYTLNDKRISVEELAKTLCKYDVISFDVFGTLILRPFTSQRVLFSIMEERLGVYKFSKIRVDSEDEIRIRSQEKYNHDNTTLHEIYDLISKKTNIQAGNAAKLEYELELKYCLANPYFKKLISICLENHKIIVACSDMYLSKSQINGILTHNGYNGFDEIFVSSELKKSKKIGDIYSLIKNKYRSRRIIHVGDNYTADIENARKSGLDAFYYRNVNDIGAKDRVSGMSYITGRVYSAIVNNHLYCENLEYDDAYKLGFVFGGIYVLGFTQWINRFANERNITKILFLSRDGDVYSKVYDKLPGHKEWEYFLWSRLAGAKITALENYYEFCQRMIWHKARGVYNIKVGHILHFFGIDHLKQYLDQYNLTRDEILSNSTAPDIERLFYDYKEEIIKSFRKDIDVTIEYVEKTVAKVESIAIVDVGWAGTGPLILKNIITKYLKLNCKVNILLAAYRQPIKNMAAIYTMDDSIHAYLFSETINRDLLDFHVNYGTKKNNLLLELFTQSCAPSFLGYTTKGLKFDREEVSNYETIKKIHSGIYDFVDYYVATFRDDPFIMNISPYDAYLPFNEIKNSSERLYSILKNLTISRGKFYDADNVSFETWLTFFQKKEQ